MYTALVVVANSSRNDGPPTVFSANIFSDLIAAAVVGFLAGVVVTSVVDGVGVAAGSVLPVVVIGFRAGASTVS